MEDKDKLSRILMENKARESVDELLCIIPEIKSMIGFDHKHPHHHLDVWEHTLEVLKGLENEDLETKMAGLLHDIGKPFSFQEGDVRHFHGHAEVSAKMARDILLRLEYDESFINNVCYLVKMHDTIIDTDALDNSYELIRKRFNLQLADAKAHHPEKVQKRLDILSLVKKKLEEKYNLWN